MIFSDDSQHLAVATWEQREVNEAIRLVPRILVIAAESGASVHWPGEIDELEFRSFAGGTVHAVASPKGEAQEFRISSRRGGSAELRC